MRRDIPAASMSGPNATDLPSDTRQGQKKKEWKARSERCSPAIGPTPSRIKVSGLLFNFASTGMLGCSASTCRKTCLSLIPQDFSALSVDYSPQTRKVPAIHLAAKSVPRTDATLSAGFLREQPLDIAPAIRHAVWKRRYTFLEVPGSGRRLLGGGLAMPSQLRP